MNVRILLLSIVLASGGFAKAVAAGDIALQEIWETGAGLKNPEWVIYDPKRDVQLVAYRLERGERIWPK